MEGTECVPLDLADSFGSKPAKRQPISPSMSRGPEPFTDSHHPAESSASSIKARDSWTHGRGTFPQGYRMDPSQKAYIVACK